MTDWDTAEGESLDIAIIGMAGRFPGADDLAAFWRNLSGGVESIVPFSDAQLAAFGVPARLRAAPNFVRAGAVLHDIDRFDAAFFGYAPSEAALMDPQHRIFLECAWAALEHAGYNAETYAGLIGVYAGTSLSTYLLYNLLEHSQLRTAQDTFPVMVGNDKDFLSTRVSYQLNLRGPSVDVQTGCSTSLVAVHLACQSLLSYQCDMALAGGVSVQVPQRTGYCYQEGGIASPDGHCRAFDARAQGTVFGSGVGVVVLKRLEEALRDGDTICAVIKGSAINNDGNLKVGYTAPSVDGQAEVIARAQAVAGVAPATISYVEAHGTATPLGDPVEIAALSKVFCASGPLASQCAVGSVKTNIGHLDAAAGVAGLIKTVLALTHGQIPPSLHYAQPNPQIDFASSPFYVNTRLVAWQPTTGPRRAGVSSFGIGGTNAHVIVEQAPPQASQPGPAWQLLPLSAKTGTALEALSASLAVHLGQGPGDDLADVAYTLQVGRKVFGHRRVLVCRDRADALRLLAQPDPQWVHTRQQEGGARPVVLLFPGGGAQYAGMGRGLYAAATPFRQAIDQCAALLLPLLGQDIRRQLYPDAGQEDQAARQLQRPLLALPALFATAYALAQQWAAWGIRPQAMIGHSLGEYVAACLAGVFTLEDALSLVVVRGRLMEQLPPGAMLSVGLPESRLTPLLGPHLALAAVNAPDQCVVAGPAAAITALADQLAQQEIDVRRLHIDVAAHSPLVEPILDAFGAAVARMDLQPPRIPLVSNVTGTWLRAEEARDPAYWVRHLRQTVYFAAGVQTLLAEETPLLLEVGPGRSLSTLVRGQAAPELRAGVLASMRHIYDPHDDMAVLLAALGRLWLAGVPIDWERLHADAPRRRLPLPSYPFERQRHWIDPQERRDPVAEGKQPDLADWLYLPSWKRAVPLPPLPPGAAVAPRRWLLLGDDSQLAEELRLQLLAAQQPVITVRPGAQFQQDAQDSYWIDVQARGDYARLLGALHARGWLPDAVVHLWSAAPQAQGADPTLALAHGYYSVLWLSQALDAQCPGHPLDLWVITSQTQQVGAGDSLRPAKATLPALCKVIPQEQAQVTCRVVDIEPAPERAGRLAGQLLSAFLAPRAAQLLAVRGGHWWTPLFEPLRDAPAPHSQGQLRERGVYLITGGLGAVGLLLAEHLARRVQARLVLVGRSAVPPPQQWAAWLAGHGPDDPAYQRVRRLAALVADGAELEVAQADVADPLAMRQVVARAIARFGALHGVIHAAGVAGAQAVRLIAELDQEASERIFRAKLHGAAVLRDCLADLPLDFCALFSSNAAVLGGPGLAAYAAANSVLDAYAAAQSDGPQRWLSINWDGWLPAGAAPPAAAVGIDQYAMTASESVQAFERVVATATAGQVLVATGDLDRRLALWLTAAGLRQGVHGQAAPQEQHPRPPLRTDYVPPHSELEQRIAAIWQDLLGIAELGTNDNFFELGGSSLIGLKVIARLKRDLGVDLPVVALFEGPTVSALAALIGQGQPATPAYEDSSARGAARRERRRRRYQTDGDATDDATAGEL